MESRNPPTVDGVAVWCCSYHADDMGQPRDTTGSLHMCLGATALRLLTGYGDAINVRKWIDENATKEWQIAMVASGLATESDAARDRQAYGRHTLSKG